MNRSLAQTLVLVTALGLAACGTEQANQVAATTAVSPVSVQPAATSPAAAPAASPAATRVVTARSAPPKVSRVHFASPEAAMRYLSAAYNRNDVRALRKVTTGSARDALLAMRAEAVNLQLEHCTHNPAGDATCEFRHDYPKAHHRAGHGDATFLVAPADKPGWYMTVLEDCG